MRLGLGWEDVLEGSWAKIRAFMASDAAVWWLLVIPTFASEVWWWFTKTHP